MSSFYLNKIDLKVNTQNTETFFFHKIRRKKNNTNYKI